MLRDDGQMKKVPASFLCPEYYLFEVPPGTCFLFQQIDNKAAFLFLLFIKFYDPLFPLIRNESPKCDDDVPS